MHYISTKVTRCSSTSLVSSSTSCEASVGALVSDSRCHRLRSRLASLTAALNLSSDRTEKWTELRGFSAVSSAFGVGSSRSINTGWVTPGWSGRSLGWTSLWSPAQQLSEPAALCSPTLAMTMGPGKGTRVARFLGCAGMASLNNNCGERNTKYSMKRRKKCLRSSPFQDT